MKFLGLLLLCIATTSFAQQWGTLNADLVVNGNASSQGTTITASVLNSLTTCGGNCVVGTSVTATGGPSGGAGTIAGFTVGANQGICSNLGPVQLTNGGTLYAAQ